MATQKQNQDGSTTVSVPLAEMTLEQLVQLSQGLGREIDAKREQRARLRQLIAQRLAAGERESNPQGGATAPGAEITAKTKKG